MPQTISGPRQARSFATPSGAAVDTRVLDFNFASDQGIEITAVLGNLSGVDLSPAASDTVPVAIRVAQSLHLEEGTIENIPHTTGEDADEIDTEMFYEQKANGLFQVPATSGGGGGDSGSSVLYLPYRDPILVARNITHRVESFATGQDGLGSVLIFYHYVRFSVSELGLILSRRS